MYKIVDAIDIKPWIRLAVLVYDDGSGHKPVHTLWRGPGGRYVCYPGTKKPEHKKQIREVCTVRHDGDGSVTSVSRADGKRVDIRGSCEKDVAKRAWSVFLLGQENCQAP